MVELRPSSAGKWVNCPGSAIAEQGRPVGDTSAADEGTVAHWIAAKILKEESIPEIGTEWEVVNKEVQPFIDFVSDSKPIIFSQEMLDYVLKYTDSVQQFKIIDIEVPVNLEYLLGYIGAKGTPDAVTQIFDEDDGILTINIHDLKYGFSEVCATDNLQLLCYAWGVYQAVRDTLWAHVEVFFTLFIHQPRLGVVGACTYSLEDIQKQWVMIGVSAETIRDGDTRLEAGDHCHKFYCKAQATCPAYQQLVNKALSTDVEIIPDLPVIQPDPLPPLLTLGDKLALLPAIRAWCKATEAEAERLALVEGKTIEGFKVVEGRRGRREWENETEAENMLKAMKIKNEHMYKQTVISPTQAEKLFKEGVIGKRQWPKLQALVDRKPAKLELVPVTDKRPPMQITADVDLLEIDIEDLIG